MDFAVFIFSYVGGSVVCPGEFEVVVLRQFACLVVDAALCLCELLFDVDW